jgi:hypothetical protein
MPGIDMDSACRGSQDRVMEDTRPVIVVFFDMVGVLEEFSHVQQLYFDMGQLRPGSSYAAEGVAALNALMRRWRRAGHAVFLVCVSGIRAEFTRDGIEAYLAARGLDLTAAPLHAEHNAPKFPEPEDALAAPATKGDEVADWLARNRCDACLVFDDINDGYRRGQYVHVEAEDGLSPEDVDKAAIYVARQLGLADRF